MTRSSSNTCRCFVSQAAKVLLLLLLVIVDVLNHNNNLIIQAQGYDWSWFKPSTNIDKTREQLVEQQEFNQRNVEILTQQASASYANRWRLMEAPSGEARYDCVEPSAELFEDFVRQYQRQLSNGTRDRFDRAVIFPNTVRRAILFNKILAADMYNTSQAQMRPEMGNYYYIKARIGRNWALWYADIDDCELGLMKAIMFNIIHMIDDNNLSGAYEKALNTSSHLPFLSSQGFQQMSEILLIRLFDRFQGDSDMNKLFKWPLYAKKLAAYAYNRQQTSQPNFKSKLGLISFAYPHFFRDIKYNTPAVNRTQDNIVINEDHELFNKLRNRKIANSKELNKRRVIFRQRVSHVRLLSEQLEPLIDMSFKANNNNADYTSVSDSGNSWLVQGPQMARFRRLNEVRLPSKLAGGYIPPREGYNNEASRRHASLIDASSPASSSGSDPRLSPIPLPPGKEQWRSQFSDLTDEEFVAYLTQDFDQLDSDQVKFLDENFSIEPLNQEFRDEIAYELLFRRTIQEHMATSNENQHQQALTRDELNAKLGPFSLARQVVDELISDIGLPMGPASSKNFTEADARDMFLRMAKINMKIYASLAGNNQPNYLPQPNEADVAYERHNRYEIFRTNYGRFKAWWKKEQWQLEGNGDSQTMLLRFADLEWLEMKLILFKLCCLNPEELNDLARHNISMHFLASNNQFLCQPIANEAFNEPSKPFRSERLTASDVQGSMQRPDEMLASELYYYYCVHFNKHHLDLDSFNDAFTIFRANIEQLKRHSCLRSHTLYKALRLKRTDMMNTMDVMDPRRSYMDDINLDRFRYFSIPAMGSQQGNQARSSSSDAPSDPELGFERLRLNGAQQRQSTNYQRARYATSNPSDPTNSAFFRNFARDQAATLNSMQEALAKPSYLEQVLEENKNHILFSRNYQAHKAHKVYDLVRDRYRLCFNMMTGLDPSDLDLSRLRCESRGKLADQAMHPVDWPSLQSRSDRLRDQQSSAFRDSNSCNYYYNGLDAWSQNLIKQAHLTAESIELARC